MKLIALNCPNCGASVESTERFCEYKCTACATVSIMSADCNKLPDNTQIEEKLNQLIAQMTKTQSSISAASATVGSTGAEVEKLVLDKLVEAGENADPQTLYYIGCFYTSGKGKIDRNARKAAEYYIKAANRGYADAQYALGLCYYNGEGVEQDYAESLQYFILASEQGKREALLYVITLYEKQLSQKSQEKKKDKKLLQEIDTTTQQLYRYLDSWANRDKNAYFDLACQYFFGTNLLKSNQLRAFKLFEKAAELGKKEAGILVGYFYEHGVPLFATYKDVKPDIDKAIKIYESIDSPVCDYLLGCFYLFGYDKKPQDFATAGKLFLRAAEQNDALSTQVLGEAYNRNIILNENKVIDAFSELCVKRKYKKLKLKNKMPAMRRITLWLMKKLKVPNTIMRVGDENYFDKGSPKHNTNWSTDSYFKEYDDGRALDAYLDENRRNWWNVEESEPFAYFEYLDKASAYRRVLKVLDYNIEKLECGICDYKKNLLYGTPAKHRTWIQYLHVCYLK